MAIRLDIHACGGCATCAEQCPVEAITMWRGFPHRSDDCILCTSCVDSCPGQALFLVNEIPPDAGKFTM